MAPNSSTPRSRNEIRRRPDPFFPGSLDNARIALRTAPSSTTRVSASGVASGENSRPLNGVTRSRPARQPAWERRDIAWSVSQMPADGRDRSASERSVSTA